MVCPVFPGSFDPLHNGHLDIIIRAQRIFGDLMVLVMENPLKSESRFTLKERLAIVNESIRDIEGTRAASFDGSLLDYLRQEETKIVVKGVRGSVDLDSEMQMAQINRHLERHVETLFLPTDPALSFVSGTRIRELVDLGVDVSTFVPKVTRRKLEGS